MPGGFLAEVVLLPGWLRAGFLKFVPDDHVGRIRKNLGLAVAGEVDKFRRLAGSGKVDLVIGPILVRLARILNPAHILGEIGDRDEVGITVCVDVHRQGGEAIAIGPAGAGDVANVVGLPVRSFVPGIARNDVEFAVVVDVKRA